MERHSDIAQLSAGNILILILVSWQHPNPPFCQNMSTPVQLVHHPHEAVDLLCRLPLLMDGCQVSVQ
jgi:hypothetical protein